MVEARYKKQRQLMINRNKRDIVATIIVGIMIIVAVVCRIATKVHLPHERIFALVRSAIYIGLFTVWGISVKKRIIRTQAKRYLIAISMLAIFWMIVRTLKYTCAVTPQGARYLWYLYYLPQLFMPLFMLFIALSLRKPETYRLPRRTMLLYIPTAICFLSVITNDMHLLVFGFSGQPWTDYNNTYAPMFYVLTLWEYFCGITALVVMWKKCRVAKNRKSAKLPIVFIVALVVYQILYLSGAQWLRLILGDSTVFSLLCFIGTLESCIRSGLIQSNTKYRELFDASTLGAVIADCDNNIMLSSENAKNIDSDVLKKTETGSVVICEKRISSAPIADGRILWQEDISELLSVLLWLEKSKQELEESSAELEKNYCAMKKLHKLSERNRLYNMMQERNSEFQKRLNGLFEKFKQESDEDEKYRLLKEIAVLGTYIKRRSNLILMSEQSVELSLNELSLCFREMAETLQLNGIDFGYSVVSDEKADAEIVIRIYDFFEKVIDKALDDISALYLTVRSTDKEFVTDITAECIPDVQCCGMSELGAEQNEDGTYHIAFSVPKEGVVL